MSATLAGATTRRYPVVQAMGTLADYTVPQSKKSGLETSLEEENDDMIWGVEPDDVPNREWSKLGEDFTNAGYREGITAGKESAVQEGFDEAFAQVGASLGRQIGVLRGAANAAVGFLSLRMLPVGTDTGVFERRNSEVWGVIGGLGRINLEDLVPPDLQAVEHAREHLQHEGTFSDTLVSAGRTANAYGIDGSESVKQNLKLPTYEPPMSPRKSAVEELTRLRIRLSDILQEIGLDMPLV